VWVTQPHFSTIFHKRLSASDDFPASNKVFSIWAHLLCLLKTMITVNQVLLSSGYCNIYRDIYILLSKKGYRNTEG
jgi:hypothetical protein